MTVVLVYLAVAAAVTPRCVRFRYGQLRVSHPHTHPRDVRYDLMHAVTGGTVRAVAWAPRAAWWVGQRGVVWVALRIVGRPAVAKDLSAARVAMLEAELAAVDATRRVDEQMGRVTRMLSA